MVDEIITLANKNEYTEQRQKVVQDVLDILQDALIKSREGRISPTSWIEFEDRVKEIVWGMG